MKQELLDRIKYFGIEAQKRKFGEEADELKEAITIHELKNSVEYEIPLAEIIGTKKHITEELADNWAMLIQFQLYYGITDEEIMKVLEKKNIRTSERIKNKYYEKNKTTIRK